jgi:hypothetical protein
MRRLLLAAALVVVWLRAALCAAAADPKPLWLVVGRAALVEAIEPLAEHRRRQGFEVIVSTEAVENAVTKNVRSSPGRPMFLLLVGDDEPGQASQAWYLPAKRQPLYRWRAVQPAEFASDAAWGDLDGDLVLDIPVGRIPARSREDVQLAVEKILAYEGRKLTPRDLQLNMWAGSPGYGELIDSASTTMLLGMLQTKAPPWLNPWLISADPRHALCGWPPDQAALFTAQVRRGSLANVLMGHANADEFSSMEFRGKSIVYTAKEAEAELAKGAPAAPLFCFSCDSGNFTRSTRCLAESLFFFRGGPVATIAASTESHPLTNYFTGVCLLDQLKGRERRLGMLWLAAQRQAKDERSFVMEAMLRDVEGKLEESIDVGKLRRDQLLMYALLGDPATAIHLPAALTAKVTPTAGKWQWSVERPKGATNLYVAFQSGGSLLGNAAKDASRSEATAAHEAANAKLAFRELSSLDGQAPWNGVVDKPGLLRLVAIGPDAVWATAVRLTAK